MAASKASTASVSSKSLQRKTGDHSVLAVTGGAGNSNHMSSNSNHMSSNSDHMISNNDHMLGYVISPERPFLVALNSTAKERSFTALPGRC